MRLRLKCCCLLSREEQCLGDVSSKGQASAKATQGPKVRAAAPGDEKGSTQWKGSDKTDNSYSSIGVHVTCWAKWGVTAPGSRVLQAKPSGQ